MKVSIDFDKLLSNSINSAIDATINLSDKNPDATRHGEQIELIAKISANVTVGILREYHEQLASSLDKLLTTPL